MKRIVLLLIFLIASIIATAQEVNPTMKETVEWLQSKAPLIKYVGADSLRSLISAKKGATWTIELKQSCLLQLSSAGAEPARKTKNLNPRAIRKPEVDPPDDPTVIYLPLGSINPQKVNIATMRGPVGEGSGIIMLTATDNKETIIWKGKDKSVNANAIAIGFSEAGMTERVQKALNHAVNLCGGRTDKKEPFE